MHSLQNSAVNKVHQRLVERVPRGLSWKICMVYLDDIVVFSKTLEEHLHNLKEVCVKLKSAGLKLHPNKYKLFQKEVSFLGHRIREDGVSTDDVTCYLSGRFTPNGIKYIYGNWKIKLN